MSAKRPQRLSFFTSLQLVNFDICCTVNINKFSFAFISSSSGSKQLRCGCLADWYKREESSIACISWKLFTIKWISRKVHTKDYIMGYISLTVLTSFTLLVAYSVLISGVHAKLSNGEGGSQAANEILQKRPASAVWLKSLPLRRLKPLNAYSLYRSDLPPSEVEFGDNSANDIEKRFDDYGHMRWEILTAVITVNVFTWVDNVASCWAKSSLHE